MRKPQAMAVDHGNFIVTTESGTRYLFDLEGQTVTRIPDSVRVDRWLAAGNVRPAIEVLAAGEFQRTPPLRRDGETLRLIGLGPIVIGQRCHMMLDVLETEPMVITSRDTSPVVSIEFVGGLSQESDPSTSHEEKS